MSRIASFLSTPTGRALLVGVFCFFAGYLAGYRYQVATTEQHHTQAQIRSRAAALAWMDLHRRRDSTYARLLGRADQQRLQQETLRHHDETHDKARPAAGPYLLPELRQLQPVDSAPPGPR